MMAASRRRIPRGQKSNATRLFEVDQETESSPDGVLARKKGLGL